MCMILRERVTDNLHWFESGFGHEEKLPVTSGKAVVLPGIPVSTTTYNWLVMTGNGHIELLNVARYNFQPSRAR